MMTSIEFLKDWRVFKKGDIIPFRAGLNLLTGDQGCGKSSLLLMLKNDGCLGSEQIAVIDAPKGTVSYYLDFEKGSVRDMDIQTADNLKIPTMAVIAHMWSSHGESVLSVLKSMPVVAKSVLLMDEPDMALSMRSIKKLYGQLTDATNAQQQIVIACHNPYLMELAGEVYSVEHRKLLSFKEFKSLLCD